MLRERNVVNEHNLGDTEERIKSLQNLASFFKTQRRTVAETSISLQLTFFEKFRVFQRECVRNYSVYWPQIFTEN